MRYGNYSVIWTQRPEFNAEEKEREAREGKYGIETQAAEGGRDRVPIVACLCAEVRYIH